MERVFEVAASITPLDAATMEQARVRQLQLTKPPGSLGRLEEIAVQMAGITRQPLPAVKRKAVIVMAADHGVAVEGVSAYPSAVTPQMVLNFLHGGAAINALARHAGAEVVIVQGLRRYATDSSEPLDVLAKVGGLEIAGFVGVIIAGAAHRIPIVTDGFISGGAALAAIRMCPTVRDYLFAGHVSVGCGHQV